jgi:uncharacterized protein YkwD
MLSILSRQSFLILFITLLLLLDTASASLGTRCRAAHNKWRGEHSVPGVNWSTNLAYKAQAHANKCVFAHSVIPR